MPRRLSNFKDPAGLIMRMVASGNRAAYGALCREALAHAVTPLDLLLSPFENMRLKQAGHANHPVILIVGPPRSGTTLVYQVLSHYLDVASPTNLCAMFERSPLTAALLQSRLVRRKRTDFHSFYGQTTAMSDCNDAFTLWNRWLGEDRYHPNDKLTPDAINDMRQFFKAWTTSFDKPFLNKNNRNTFAISRLSQHLPNSKFIVVRRNPVFVAQSLIIARQRIQGSKAEGWGLESSSISNSSDPLAHVDSVCDQILRIEHRMQDQLCQVDPHRVIEITYEDFCRDPQQTVLSVAHAFDGVNVARDIEVDSLKPFDISRNLSVSPEEQTRIRERLAAPRQPEFV